MALFSSHGCRCRRRGARSGGASLEPCFARTLAGTGGRPTPPYREGAGMAGKRQRVEPTEDWDQLELLLKWPEQREYEIIRPVVIRNG